MSPTQSPSPRADAWLPGIYDTKVGFVASFGNDVLQLLDPQAGEIILDLGCGTGDLTQKIAERGAAVIGLDGSPAMIERARQKFPTVEFIVGDGQDFDLSPRQFDAVFSNAAIHWMKNSGGVVDSVWQALRPGGRFVAEFGGNGNVRYVIDAVAASLAAAGFPSEGFEPWYFPTIGAYATLLEARGFRVVQAFHFDRPTPLVDGDRGMANWLTVFGEPLFDAVPNAQKPDLVAAVIRRLRPALYADGQWTTDYKRLRVVALKSAR